MFAVTVKRQTNFGGLTGGGFFGGLGGVGSTSSVETGEKRVSFDSFFWKGFMADSFLSPQAFGFSRQLGQLPAYSEKGD